MQFHFKKTLCCYLKVKVEWWIIQTKEVTSPVNNIVMLWHLSINKNIQNVINNNKSIYTKEKKYRLSL